MWQLADYAIASSVWNETQPDPDDGPTHQLRTGEIQLINAIEWVNWGEDPLQFIVCHCGIVRCQPQNWVSLRRTGEIALLMPAFSKLVEADAWMQSEYGAPAYLLSRGAMYTEHQVYGDLCQHISFPPFASLPQLSAQEAAKIIQLEAPHQVFGNYLQPIQLVPEVVVASTEGNFMEQVPLLLQHLRQLETSDQPVRLRQLKPGEEAIAFYLDIAGIPQWPVLSFDGSAYSLYLHPGYVIEVGEFEP